MNAKIRILIFLMFIVLQTAFSQDVALYDQANGKYDFIFIGNTLNVQENGANDPCLVNTTSTANLNLGAGDTIFKAYLYWAGSGTGDFDVKLNGTDLTATRTFSLIFSGTGLPFFSAFADVTSLLQTTGNGAYTLSEFDVSPWLNPNEYCINGTNFAGWAIVIVYENPSLPLNQINIYDGLQGVPNQLSIQLNSLNVIDNDGAKIGFVAWEGDRSIANGEILTINGSPISNPPLNPVSNAFNGTNSFTNSITLYNMDLDVYDIQNNIQPGDETAQIALASAQDFVMINVVVTKLNSQLPDATVVVDNIGRACDSHVIDINYTVYNVNSTDILPGHTPVSVYVDGVYHATVFTENAIPVGGNEPGQVTIRLPDSITGDFTIQLVADDAGLGQGTVAEINELNNAYSVDSTLLLLPEINPLPPLESCNLGFTSGLFDFSGYDDLVRSDPSHEVSYFESMEDAEANVNEILNITNYQAASTPKTIYVRVENESCFSVGTFELIVRNCPPTVYNYVSANNDGTNDIFFIDGLRNIFVNFELEVYNRWGRLIWDGDNNSEDWDGHTTKGIRIGGSDAPDGTYYYILYLNDPDYREPLVGYLYLNR